MNQKNTSGTTFNPTSNPTSNPASNSARLFLSAALLLGSFLFAGTDSLSASSIKVCSLTARVLKVLPNPAGQEGSKKNRRPVRILVEKSVFSGGHSMGRNCRLKGMKLDIQLRITPPQAAEVLKAGAVLKIKYRTVINQRRKNGKWRFVRFTSYRYVAPKNNNKP